MTATLWARCDFVNETRGHIFGSEEWQETRFDADERGKLFRDCQSEYGRCVSKMYVDLLSGGTRVVGWVFQSRQEYEDYRGRGERYYVREVWVHVEEREQ